MALFAYVRIYPIAWSVVLSFYDWNLIRAVQAVRRLRQLRAHVERREFPPRDLKNTPIYSVATVVLSTLIALPLAVLLARHGRLSAIYQTVYFLPVITPMVPMAIAWKWIYDYNYGLLNYALSFVGMAPVAWLTDPRYRALGAHHHERLEGAGLQPDPVPGRHPQHPGELSRGRLASTAPTHGRNSATSPCRCCSPILLYVLVTATINAFNVFTQVYVMTLGSQAAPGQAVRVLVFDIYQNAFQYFRMGYASAEAVALTFIVLGFTLIQFRARAVRRRMMGGERARNRLSCAC